MITNNNEYMLPFLSTHQTLLTSKVNNYFYETVQQLRRQETILVFILIPTHSVFVHVLPTESNFKTNHLSKYREDYNSIDVFIFYDGLIQEDFLIFCKFPRLLIFVKSADYEKFHPFLNNLSTLLYRLLATLVPST